MSVRQSVSPTEFSHFPPLDSFDFLPTNKRFQVMNPGFRRKTRSAEKSRKLKGFLHFLGEQPCIMFFRAKVIEMA